MMRAGDIVVLDMGVLRQGVRDADTEDSKGFGVLFDNQKYLEASEGTRCLFRDEGTRWTRGTIDSPAARALLTVASLRAEYDVVICSECGAQMPSYNTHECEVCEATFP